MATKNEIRVTLGLSQRWVATFSHCTKESVSAYEHGLHFAEVYRGRLDTMYAGLERLCRDLGFKLSGDD